MAVCRLDGRGGHARLLSFDDRIATLAGPEDPRDAGPDALDRREVR
jgi:hypothetical protein